FAWLEQDQPELFAQVKQRVAEGRFLPVGGMWVESDAVMPTGESLIRQFLLGMTYFRERFGVEPDGVWLPDSFGYSGALPQLARRTGFDWFLTQKISWNDTNTFPHHSFDWEGIDGTKIFTHFPPTETYAAEVSRPSCSTGSATSGTRRVPRTRCCCSATATAVAGPPGRWWPAPTAVPIWKSRPRCSCVDPRSSSLRPRVSTGPAVTFPLGAGSCTWNCTGVPSPPNWPRNRATGAPKPCCARWSTWRPMPR